MEKITVKTIINAPLERVWECWTTPEHITKWNFASNDWECPQAKNDLRVDGKFTYVMSAKDKSFSFYFEGIYTNIEEYKIIEYVLADGRQISVSFASDEEGVSVSERFDPENENSAEKQRAGWQAILENFKNHVEHCT